MVDFLFFIFVFVFFLFWGMVCTFCLKSKHTIVSCTKEKVEEKREKRKNNTKSKEKKKTKKKKEKETKQEQIQFKITLQKKKLHTSIIKLGCLCIDLQEKCKMVKGVIKIVLLFDYF